MKIKRKHKKKDIKGKVLRVLNKNSSKSLNYKQIASKMGIKDAANRDHLIKTLVVLKKDKKIKETSRGKYQIIPKNNYYEGIIDINQKGMGFVTVDGFSEDVFIPKNGINKALNADLVKIYIYKRSKGRRIEAEVVEILERERTTYVGIIDINDKFSFVRVDGNRIHVDIFVPLSKIGKAKDKDKVLVELNDWPERADSPYGKVIKVLGKSGEHNTEIHSILAGYDLPYDFPQDVQNEANEIDVTITKEEIEKRRDMRTITTFTIDPKDAKDFDDALSFEKLENGNYEIGIHIADVSHYVKPGTILDEEAYKRATSVYLVDRVVPMLPEILSNKVCSLRPHEEKYTFSAIFQLNDKAEIVEEWFGRTVIYSDRRFTYEEAQEVIETGKGDFVYEITTLDRLAKIMRSKRSSNGAISFDTNEVRFILDENANPIETYVKKIGDSNHLIEEFMLLANKRVAKFVGQNKGKPSKKTMVYRIHDEPDTEKIASLQNVIAKFGYKIDTRNRDTLTSSLNKLMLDAQDTPEKNMISTLIVRSMSKAEYSIDNIGHYGLAFDYYSHFTSPIRRYPDVMVHRLLQHYLDGGKSVNAEEYVEKCKHSSYRENLATKAERESIKYMQIRFMELQKDREFLGVISGVTEWGIYVEITENSCEGMVRVKDIKDDNYYFDKDEYALVGRESHNMYRLGDEVKVKVKHTDLERRHLDFYMVSEIKDL